MDMIEWAKQEIDIACKREKNNAKDGECGYGIACYQSALKAFETLCEDGHSCCSIQITQSILNRLINGKTLSPIEDSDDIWILGTEEPDYKEYQCTRMSSLFKKVTKDGTISYCDINRFVAVDTINDLRWSSGLITKIGSEMYPITMPYVASDKPYEVYFEQLLTDRKNGDFDTEAILYIKTPEGKRTDINRYFREPNPGEVPTYNGWVEIDKSEYEHRRELDITRRAYEQANR